MHVPLLTKPHPPTSGTQPFCIRFPRKETNLNKFSGSSHRRNIPRVLRICRHSCNCAVQSPSQRWVGDSHPCVSWDPLARRAGVPHFQILFNESRRLILFSLNTVNLKSGRGAVLNFVSHHCNRAIHTTHHCSSTKHATNMQPTRH